MDYSWILTEAEKLCGTLCQYQPEWEATKIMVGGKMYAMLGEYKDGRPLLTLKLPPERNDFLRQNNPDIIPGYYSNKTHWSSIFLDTGSVANEELSALLREAHNTGLGGLTKKLRAQIEAGG